MQNEDLIQESWDKKRIFFGILIFIFLIGLGYLFFGNSILEKSKLSKPSFSLVKGVSTKEDENLLNDKDKASYPFLSSKIDLEKKLDSIKTQVKNLNVSDLASSSPQVQKIMEDFEALQQLPKNQVKEACYNICKGL